MAITESNALLKSQIMTLLKSFWKVFYFGLKQATDLF